MRRGRRGWLAGLCVLGFLGSAAASASAASPADAPQLWWYGKDNATCRHSGFPDTEARTCVPVGPDYLNTHPGGPKVHFRVGGVVQMAVHSPGGEFCYTHRYNGEFDQQIDTDQTQWTGFRPPLAYLHYQQGDHGGNRCQAHGTKWGQHVRGTTANDFCRGVANEPCGMAHYTSFASEGLRNRPWDPLFGPFPTLNIAVTADPQAVEVFDGKTFEIDRGVPGGAWGYVCALLKDVTLTDEPWHVIEYCFEEWKVGRGFPDIRYDEEVECNGGNRHITDQVVVRFGSYATEFATPRFGTPDTVLLQPKQVGVVARRHHISITRRDMARAIAADKRWCPNGRRGSDNPSDWALIGVENGIEGGGLTRIGGNTSSLELTTTKDTLSEWDQMSYGQQIISANGRYRAQMQPDGNFVVYDANNVPIWKSDTYGADGARLIMQPDDNLVIRNRDGAAIWHTGTSVNSGKSRLLMADDGNLVLFRGGGVAWSSRG